MSGDYTRLTFRPERGFSAVRLQQGRVQVDADWNEAADIGLHLARTTTHDVVGPNGAPEDDPGFALTAADPDGGGAGSDLLIGFGRAYVDGILVENLVPTPTRLTAVAAAPGDFLVAGGPVPAMGQWLVPLAGAGGSPARVTALTAPAPENSNLTRITLTPPPAGASISLTIAPSLLLQPDLTGDPVPAAARRYGLYLKMFERAVTALDDPYLRETALGGPDTCLRTQVVWQVRADAGGTSCADYLSGWQPDNTPRALMAAQGVPAIADDDPCLIPDPGGYRGIDNRLYRVEVHHGGDVEAGQVLVKWSRDNAIHRTTYTVVAGRLRVASLGRDDATTLAQEQWVELQDEAAWRALRPGPMVRLGEVNGLDIAVAEIRDPETNAVLVDGGGDPQVAALPRSGLLRRWEGGPPVAVVADTPLALESGIEVTFGAGRLRAADWWTIPARTLTAKIEWPQDPATGDPLAIPAQAVARHFMPLGIVERLAEGRLRPVSDCRPLFPPLTHVIAFEMLGGDGQEISPVMPPGDPATPVPLPLAFRVGVCRGKTPVAGRLVEFSTADAPNPGQLSPTADTPPAAVQTNTPQRLVVLTGADGVAKAAFAVNGNREQYRVLAKLLDLDGVIPTALTIRFGARLLRAVDVGYDPSACPDLRAAGATTVQAALDALCARPQGGEGCCIPVGEKGRFKTIGVALDELKEERDICLCLMPGDHQLDGMPDAADTVHRNITIQGSGPDLCRLHVDKGRKLGLVGNGIRLIGFSVETEQTIFGFVAENIAIENMRFEGAVLDLRAKRELRISDSRISVPSTLAMEVLKEALADAPFLFEPLPLPYQAFWEAVSKGIPEIENMTADARAALSKKLSDTINRVSGAFSANELRGLLALARSVTAGGSVLSHALGSVRDEALRARPELALVIASNQVDARIERNDILGSISMFGPPGNIPPQIQIPGEGTVDAWQVLVTRTKEQDFASQSTGLLWLQHNRLSLLTVDQKTMDALGALANGQGVPLPAWTTAMVSENIWAAAPLILISENITLGQNRFEGLFSKTPSVLVGGTATCLGNAGPDKPDNVLYCATRQIVPSDSALRGSLNAPLNIVH